MSWLRTFILVNVSISSRKIMARNKQDDVSSETINKSRNGLSASRQLPF
jgi:hypothetical protein